MVAPTSSVGPRVVRPGQRALPLPAVAAQSLARLDALAGDPRRMGRSRVGDGQRLATGGVRQHGAWRTAMGSACLALRAVVGWGILLACVGVQTATAQEQPSPIPRPDLTLRVQDLPPGYAEAPALGLTFSGRPVEDRALRRTTPDSGPQWVWSATFEAGIPLTEERVARLGQELARSLGTRFLDRVTESIDADVVFLDWAEVDPAGLGEHATLYRFDVQRLDERDPVRRSEGALLVFSRGGFLSVLATLSAQGQATVDLRQYARVVDERMAREPPRGP
jgi:hypothetical protein